MGGGLLSIRGKGPLRVRPVEMHMHGRPVPPPSGTITFLFTDIEGSTRRWDRDRAAMQEAVRHHDRLLREAIAAHHGYVFKTIGDAFCAAFATPEATALAALDAQKALDDADFSSVDGLPVRMAINTGTADERDGDYFGPTVNRVARLLSLGHGGQILLSGIAADLVRENPPPRAELVELGSFALKDLERPEDVYQLTAPGLPRDFPDLRTKKASGPWLVPDAMRTRYFTGRDDLLEQLGQKLAERHRAVLSGLGGIGKTQTALEYAARNRAKYPAGVFWVNAETASGAASGFVEIAKTLHLASADSSDRESVVESVCDWLSESDRWLLILDNVDERREIARFVPGRAAGDVLVTSRESVFAELGIPRALEVGDLAVDDAVRFLLTRTGRSEDNDSPERQAAVELAEELGNLALALEQAAAYIAETNATFSGYLNAFRKRRVALLEKASALVPRECVSMTWAANFAAVEQTSRESGDVLRFSALLAPEGIPFGLLETFSGGDEMATFELLRPLARYSLVRVDPAEREYGVHRLVQEIVRAALGDTECRAYVDRAVTALDAAFPPAEFASWARSDALVPHVVSVMAWGEYYDVRPTRAAELLNKAGRYLLQRGRYAESVALVQKALTIGREMFGPDHSHIATSLNVLAIVYGREGKFAESEPLYEMALAMRERLLGPEHPDVANSSLNFGNLYFNQGRYAEAQRLYERAVEIWQRKFGWDHEGVATATNNIARICEEMGRHDEAQRLDEQALAIRERIFGADHPQVAVSFGVLANDHARRGRFAEAEALHERAIAILERALGLHHDELGECLHDLAKVYMWQGRHDKALPLYERALGIFERAFGSHHPSVADSLQGLASIYLKEGRFLDAEPLLERAVATRERSLGPDHLKLAESLIGIASLYSTRGQHEQAVPRLERALQIKQRTFSADHPELIEIVEALETIRNLQREPSMYGDPESPIAF
jgi:class 3 adenylate cyclase/tetratricopeptide (TPR) repeat protein